MRAYLLGSIAGALTTGLMLLVASGFLAPLTQSVRPAHLIPIALLALCKDLGQDRIPWPGAKRQVREDVLRTKSDSLVGMAQFGYEMGTGVRTYMTAGSPLVVAVAILTGVTTPIGGLAATGAFGAARGVVPILHALSGDRRGFSEALAALGVKRIAPAITSLSVIIIILLHIDL